MDRNSNGYKSVNTNGNIVRTKVKLYDSKDEVIAIFATGNGWSDGKLPMGNLIGGVDASINPDDPKKEYISVILSASSVLKGSIDKNGKFNISVSNNGELYGFLNSPMMGASFDENDMARIEKVRKSKKCRLEVIVSQESCKKHLNALTK